MYTRQYHGMLMALENVIDMILNLLAMVVSYMVAIIFIPPTVVFYDPTTIVLIFLALLLSFLIYHSAGLYDFEPFVRMRQIISATVRANVVFFGSIVLLVALFGQNHGVEFLTLWLLICAFLSTAMLIVKKQIISKISAAINRSRYKVKRVIIVGDNTATSEDFVKQVNAHPEYSLMIVGHVGNKIDKSIGCEKLGSLSELDRVLDEQQPDMAIFAVDAYDKRHIIRLVNMCDDRCIKVYFLPVIYGYFKNPKQIERIGTLPVINTHSTPLDNLFNAAVKRAFDIIGSLLLILLTSPVMIGAAIAVAISSPGPIFFKQERVGKLGKNFTMLKFRSMRVNVDSDTEWSRGVDPRKTRVGNFLRKTSIDELPQLFNVLFGSMSLVGPRPEIPYYVDYFKTRIPLYMVKHYVKPGITGLAQIKGLRGDTSIEDRIHCDLEYIENWTLGLDIGILLMTPFKAFNKHERYGKSGQDAHAAHENETVENAPDDAEVMAMEMKRRESRGKGKILYAASTMSHINNFHTDYIERLRADGYVVKVMAKGAGADYNIPFEKKLLSPINTACRQDIKRILTREKFDAIILNTSLAAFHIRLACPKLQRPRIINIVHGYLFSKTGGKLKNAILLLCEKLLAKRTDSIIVMNDEDRRIVEKHRLCTGEVYTTRGMGAQIRAQKTATESIRDEFRLNGKYVMSFVGELSERKNQEFLINAHRKIKEKIPEAVLMLVGNGALREYYESLIDEYDLADSVILTGQREDACDIMRASDLYVSASSVEGMPFNIIEALGCGKTVVASRIKGHEDLIENCKSGYLFEYGKTDDYIDCVVNVYIGNLRLDKENIEARYRLYDKKNVLPETYGVIKEAIVKK